MGAQPENGLRAGGKNVAVIGVTPPGFQFPGDTGTVLNIFSARLAQLCVPLALTPQTPSARSTHCLEAIPNALNDLHILLRREEASLLITKYAALGTANSVAAAKHHRAAEWATKPLLMPVLAAFAPR